MVNIYKDIKIKDLSTFFLNKFHKKIKDSNDIEKYAKLKLLGVLPAYSDNMQQISNGADTNLYEKSINDIRNKIQHISSEKDSKVILITNCENSKEKARASVNIAASFVAINKKVLFIDSDVVKQRLCYKYIRKTPIPNFHILTDSTISQKTSELLVLSDLEKFIKKVKKTYDLIVIDIPIADEDIALSSFADFTILVVHSNKTKINELKIAKNTVQNVGGEIIGCILTKQNLNEKVQEESYCKKSIKNDNTSKKEEIKNKKIRVYNKALINKQNKRINKLEKIIEDLNKKVDSSKNIEKSIENKNKLVKQEINKMQEEIKKEIRQEIEKMQEGTKEEIYKMQENIKSETKQEISKLQEEMKKEISREINVTQEKIRSTREKIKKEAIQKITETNKQIKEETDKEINQVQEKIAKETRQEISRIQEQTKKEIARIQESTNQEIKQEINNIQEEIKKEIEQKIIKVNEQANKKVDNIQDKIKEETDTKIDNIQKGMNEQVENVQEEMNKNLSNIQEIINEKINETEKENEHIIVDKAEEVLEEEINIYPIDKDIKYEDLEKSAIYIIPLNKDKTKEHEKYITYIYGKYIRRYKFYNKNKRNKVTI